MPFNSRFRALIIFLILLTCGVSAQVSHGPVFIPEGKIYNVGSNQIKFFYVRDELSKYGGAGRYAQKMIQKDGPSHKAGVERYIKLPNNDTAEQTRLLLGWYSVWGPQKGQSGWIEVYGTTGAWRYRTNSGESGTIPNGRRDRRRWTLDGYPIEIQVYNPENNRTWTNRDIIYRFILP